jgi:hypothetical protein
MINLHAGKSISRQVSLRAVFRAVRERGEISRAELSRLTGLSKQTISEVVGELAADGWLREAGQTSGNIGRTATNYELNGDRAHVFGCDLGGTKIMLAIADLTGRVIAERTIPTSPAGGQAVVEQIAGLVTELTAESGIPQGSLRLRPREGPAAPCLQHYRAGRLRHLDPFCRHAGHPRLGGERRDHRRQGRALGRRRQ